MALRQADGSIFSQIQKERNDIRGKEKTKVATTFASELKKLPPEHFRSQPVCYLNKVEVILSALLRCIGL